MIPVYKPYWPKDVKKYAVQALDDGWLTYHKFNQEVEERLAELLGVRHVLLTCNGTTATHLVVKALKFKHPHIERVVVPNIVYVAAWNSLLYDNSFNSIIQAKTDQDTWNMDSFDVMQFGTEKDGNQGDRTAILAVHNLGNPIKEVPEWVDAGIPVIEDACEAFFGFYNGKLGGQKVGSASLAASLSFFGNKTITCGEGGAVLTNDNEVAQYLRKIWGQGQTRTRYIHDELGYNYRMTNIQAGILKGQLEHLNDILEKKLMVWERYRKAFEDREDVKIQKVEQGCEHSRWMFGVNTGINESFEDRRKFFAQRGIDIRPMFYPIRFHTHLNLDNRIWMREDPMGEMISRCSIMLPSYPDLTKDDQDKVIQAVNDYVRKR
jgi:perosamine synthetase